VVVVVLLLTIIITHYKTQCHCRFI
jgi:hypothetical protein